MTKGNAGAQIVGVSQSRVRGTYRACARVRASRASVAVADSVGDTPPPRVNAVAAPPRPRATQARRLTCAAIHSPPRGAEIAALVETAS
jgi:hypothetical protein